MEDREERQKLIEENMKLAYWMANRYRQCGIEYDDLVSVCFLGLVKAADGYVPEKGKFSGYAAKVMWNEILQELRRDRRRIKYCVSLEDEAGDGMQIASLIPDPEDPYKDMLDRMMAGAVSQLIDRILTRRELLAFRLVCLDGMRQEAAAEIVGSSQSYVSRLCRNAQKKVRKAMYG